LPRAGWRMSAPSSRFLTQRDVPRCSAAATASAPRCRRRRKAAGIDIWPEVETGEVLLDPFHTLKVFGGPAQARPSVDVQAWCAGWPDREGGSVAQRGPNLKAGALSAGSPPRPPWPPQTHGTATFKHLAPFRRGQRAKGPNVVPVDDKPTPHGDVPPRPHWAARGQGRH
jgi:hypothetical protein